MELHSVKNDAGLRLKNFQKHKQSKQTSHCKQDYFHFTVTCSIILSFLSYSVF
mgnify:FL=1